MTQLQTVLDRYVLPCLPGMLIALAVLTGVFFFFARCCAAARPRKGSLEWVALQERTPFSFTLSIIHI